MGTPKKNSTLAANLMFVVLLLTLPLTFLLKNETFKDAYTGGLTLIVLGLAIYFNRKLKKEDGFGWLNFSVVFTILCIFILADRWWDFASAFKDSVNPDNIDPKFFKMLTKLGERTAFVGMGVFALSAVTELFKKLLREVGLE